MDISLIFYWSHFFLWFFDWTLLSLTFSQQYFHSQFVFFLTLLTFKKPEIRLTCFMWIPMLYFTLLSLSILKIFNTCVTVNCYKLLFLGDVQTLLNALLFISQCLRFKFQDFQENCHHLFYLNLIGQFTLELAFFHGKWLKIFGSRLIIFTFPNMFLFMNL